MPSTLILADSPSFSLFLVGVFECLLSVPPAKPEKTCKHVSKHAPETCVWHKNMNVKNKDKNVSINQTVTI